MVSTYVNNLRLEEMESGANSGTWGTKTNVNLELVGQALGYGTRAIANASTDNITIADGTSDADRSMYLKLTGGGQACTITLLPNTSSKMWVMENATSAALTFTQGSGANVVIAAGQTKMIFADGLGSGAVVHELGAFTFNGALTITGVTTHGDDVVSDTDSTDDLGTTGVRWANLFVDAITATDQITATGFTGTLDGILGSGSPAAASVTTLGLGGELSGADNVVSRVNLKDYGEVTQALGSAGGTRTVDLANGNSASATVSASTNTFVFSNPTASDEACAFTLVLVNGGSQTVNWPGTVDWPAATAPTLTASGTDLLVFITIDGGTIWHGMVASTASA